MPSILALLAHQEAARGPSDHTHVRSLGSDWTADKGGDIAFFDVGVLRTGARGPNRRWHAASGEGRNRTGRPYEETCFSSFPLTGP